MKVGLVPHTEQAEEKYIDHLFRCASISWIHVGESVTQSFMFLRFCQIFGIYSGMFRVCSECVQSVFRVCSECVQSAFRVCS